MPPPPNVGGDGSTPPSPAQVNPTTPTSVSPAPAQPSPQMDQGTQLAVGVTSGLVQISKQFPATAPLVAQMSELMRQVMAKMMESQQTGEPAAPPMPG